MYHLFSNILIAKIWTKLIDQKVKKIKNNCQTRIYLQKIRCFVLIVGFGPITNQPRFTSDSIQNGADFNGGLHLTDESSCFDWCVCCSQTCDQVCYSLSSWLWVSSNFFFFSNLWRFGKLMKYNRFSGVYSLSGRFLQDVIFMDRVVMRFVIVVLNAAVIKPKLCGYFDVHFAKQSPHTFSIENFKNCLGTKVCIFQRFYLKRLLLFHFFLFRFSFKRWSHSACCRCNPNFQPFLEKGTTMIVM